MITLKITMNSGEEFIIRNFAVEDKVHFVTQVLAPQRVLLRWYEVVPGTLIKVENISSITELAEDDLPEKEDEVVGDIDGAEIVLTEDLENVEISEKKEPIKADD